MKVVAINPGSTSTKIAVFEEETEIFRNNITHSAEELSRFEKTSHQMEYRVKTIFDALAKQNISLSNCAAFSGRGGGLVPCSGGVYRVTPLLLEHASSGLYGGDHPAALGGQIAQHFAQKFGGKAFVVNPPDTDEFCDEARVTGFSDIFRASHIHTLNQKETAHRVATDIGKSYEESNFIVAHIGGGVSVTAHRRGKMIDSNDIIEGDGPMAPTRSGSVPAKALMKLCLSGILSLEELDQRLTKSGGFVDHLGTSDVREVLERIAQGDQYAALVFDAFIYQIIKYIGAMGTALSGAVDAIILTGGIAHNSSVVQRISDATSFIAPVMVRAGEFEMESLAAGALRVLRGTEAEKTYTGIPVFTNFDALKRNTGGMQ